MRPIVVGASECREVHGVKLSHQLFGEFGRATSVHCQAKPAPSDRTRSRSPRRQQDTPNVFIADVAMLAAPFVMMVQSHVPLHVRTRSCTARPANVVDDREQHRASIVTWKRRCNRHVGRVMPFVEQIPHGMIDGFRFVTR